MMVNPIFGMAAMPLPVLLHFVAKPQLRAQRCRPVDSVMMCYPRVGIPSGVPSLADEVVKQNARNNTGRMQEDVRQPSGASRHPGGSPRYN